jgi:hypothetical protein
VLSLPFGISRLIARQSSQRLRNSPALLMLLTMFAASKKGRG